MVTLAALLLAATQPEPFADRLWDALPTAKGNVVVSPTSLNACLGLLIDGVGPASRGPLAKAFGIAQESLDAYDASLQARLRTLTEGDEATVSNGGFFASTPAPAYVEAVSRGFGAAIERLLPGAAGVKQVNGWVERHTKGRIPRLFDALSPGAEAILVNAVTFDGTWRSAFSAANTRKEAFAAPSGSRQVDTMHLPMGRFGYAKGAGFSLVTLPYAGGRYRMTVILPDGGDPARLLGGPEWRTARDRAEEAPVDLALPRFTVRSSPDVEKALKAMGLAPLFRSLDFHRAAPSGAVRRIDEIAQKTYLQVDEKGTKAAAATGIVSIRAMRRPETPVRFHVDRPFAFAVEHVGSGEPLFMGVIREP